MTNTPNRFKCDCSKKSTTSVQPDSNGSKSVNRFSGGCKVNQKSESQRNGLDDLTYVKDIYWYPDRKTMVVEQNNHKNVVIDFSTIISDTTKTISDIRVAIWNPNKTPEPGTDTPGGYDTQVLVPKDTELTAAIQTIVNNISSDNATIFRTNVSKVAQDVIDANTRRLTSIRYDIIAHIYDDNQGEPQLTDTVLVEAHTDLTDAIQTIVNKARMWDVWDD